MATIVLLIALAIMPLIGQASDKSTFPIDMSGTWRDEGGWIWTISQNGTQITLVSSDGTTKHVGRDGHVIEYVGKLDGRSIIYTDWTVLGEASSEACRSFVGQTFEFTAKLKISKDTNKVERKAPASVTKGQCKLSLKRMPGFVLNRISGK